MIAAAAAGIAVFATGGIGGVHRGAISSAFGSGQAAEAIAGTLDISSDLEELARTPVAVVCAGPKAILDLPLTLEYLETRGVPVVAARPGRGARVLRPVEWRPGAPIGPRRARRGELDRAPISASASDRGCSSASRCRPRPPCRPSVARRAVDQAVAEAEAAGIHGPALTPWLLARIAELTDGASLRANIALIENDARVAGRLAVALAG